MRKFLFAAALTALASSWSFAQNVDFDLEYKKVTHNYDLLDSTDISIEYGLGRYSTIIKYDHLGIAVVMDYEDEDLSFYVYREPGSTYELPRPIDTIAKAMAYTEAPGATAVFFVEKE